MEYYLTKKDNKKILMNEIFFYNCTIPLKSFIFEGQSER